MNMKNIVKIFAVMLMAANMFSQTVKNDIDKNVVKNVVLINSAPWEVLMSKNGDILAKLNYLPDFLKGYDVDWQEDTNYEPDIPIAGKLDSKKQSVALNSHVSKVNNTGINKIQEVYFSVGSALLSNGAIRQLNQIANTLINDKNKTMRLFGFVNEPDSRYSILGKRRMDAVIAYLRIKGVDVDTQVKRGNNVKGQNNKIVLASN